MSKIRFLVVCGLLTLVAVAVAPDAHAASKSFIEAILTDGGVIGWVIILLSVVMLAMGIDYMVNLKHEKICPPELIDEVEALLEEGDYQEALELCESEPNFVTRSLASGLPRINDGYSTIKESVENTAGAEAVKLQQKVGWMLFLSNVAPMLGLFGTVEGMIRSFNVIVEKGANLSPADLAGGISAALVTTFLGLLVAMPATFIYQYYRNKVTRIAIHFGNVLEEMIERFRGK